MIDQPPLGPADLSTLERIACELATEAGRLIVEERPRHVDVAATKSTGTDVVTVMDQRSEELLRTRLEELRPQDGLLGEEGGSKESSSGITWVVDPIDGTVNYLYDIPAYAVSVAACVGDVSVAGAWHTVAGAVINPVTGELFHARQGGGAFLRRGEELTLLNVSGQRDLALSLLGTGFGYAAQKRREQISVVAAIIGEVRDIRRIGSAALDLCSVAAGRLDVYYESGLNAWDQAAGQLIVTEAGGVVRGRHGAPAGKELVIAGPDPLVTDLAALIDA
ncbi:inositol monophosphatase family protein [Rudaeicoccus suwonensis]|uniref:Inositol-1-monophosphatase n=1 Tax=Rudaeicoccus suwonensis TaxID=657409 RepID=A0A561EBI4_9MICO|nr:inositol monophosphatase family protein [Rudaeicoccus suwonensis]TWE12970.1 myo-inositol-1(or 4)-monophosphatase [Rudaeicoccus suwonensis]